MKVIYMKCCFGDIIHCEAPPGSKVFWPNGYPSSKRKGPGTWKTLETIKDSLEPRARILTVTGEIQDTSAQFKQALKRAWAKLPQSYRKRGVLGVTLKGEPYRAEGKSWRQVGFFYVPSVRKWERFYGNNIVESLQAPKGFPDQTW